MTSEDAALLTAIRNQAVAHAQAMHADVENARDRGEHIRLTRLAEEAYALVASLDLALTPPEQYAVEISYLPTHV